MMGQICVNYGNIHADIIFLDYKYRKGYNINTKRGCYMKHKIAFFDMDGTLYQTENDVILDSSLDAIQQLKDAGFIVCAATGRPLNQLSLILPRVTFDYYVLINGGYILDRDFNEIAAYEMNKDDVNAMVKLCQEQKYGLMFHFGDATYIYNDFYPMYYFCKYCNVLDSLFYDPTQSYHHRHRVFNAVVLTKDSRALEEFLDNHKSLRMDLINVKTDGFCYDVFNAMNDKYIGIEAILKKENLTWNDAICFGDSTNDIHMLKKAGLGVAMGNASDYVKSFADFSTTSTYDNGIYNAVRKILKENN